MLYNGWVKLHRKVLGDGKSRAMSPSKRWVFIGYLLLAKPQGKWAGYIVDDEDMDMSLVDQAYHIGVDRSWLCRVRKEFIGKGLLSVGSGDRLKVTNYHKYQSVVIEDSLDDAVSSVMPTKAPAVRKPRAKTAKLEQPAEEPVTETIVPRCGPCSKPSTATTGLHFVVQQMHDRYKDKFGMCPTIVWGRDANILKSLLNRLPEADVLKVYDHFVTVTDAYIVKNGYDIPTFKMKYDGVALSLKNGKQYGGVVSATNNNKVKSSGNTGVGGESKGSRFDQYSEAVSG